MRTARTYRRSVSAPGRCAARPARGWWPRRSRSATGTSTRHRAIRTRPMSGRGSPPRACRPMDIFVTTKVTPERTSKALLVRSVEESLRKLRRDQVDLLLVALAESEDPGRRDDRRPLRGEAAGARPAYRPLELYDRVDRGGAPRRDRAAGRVPDRVSPAGRPDQDPRDACGGTDWRSSPIARSRSGGWSATR